MPSAKAAGDTKASPIAASRKPLMVLTPIKEVSEQHGSSQVLTKPHAAIPGSTDPTRGDQDTGFRAPSRHGSWLISEDGCLTSGRPSSTAWCCTGSIRRMALRDSTRSDRARPRSGGLPWACVTRLILDRCYTQGRDTAGDRIRSGFNRSAGARSGRSRVVKYECSLCLLYSCDFISIRSADGADRCDWSLGNRDNLQGWKVR